MWILLSEECKPPLVVLIIQIVGYTIVMLLCLRIIYLEQTDLLFERVKTWLKKRL